MSNVKITANLPISIAEAMKTLADKDGVSMTEILRRAVAREKFFNDAIEKGHTIILKDKDGKMKEVFFNNDDDMV